MSIRNYNAFLKAVRRKHGITQKQAQKAYRRVTKRIGRAAIGADVRKHPRIVKDAVKPVRGANKSKSNRRVEAPKHGRKTTTTDKLRRVRKIARPRTIEEWVSLYDQATDFEDERVVSSADYGKGKRGK